MKAKIILGLWVVVSVMAFGWASIGAQAPADGPGSKFGVGGPVGVGAPVPLCAPGAKCQVDPMLEGGPMPPLCRPGTCPNTKI
jgi:hypothetical protein